MRAGASHAFGAACDPLTLNVAARGLGAVHPSGTARRARAENPTRNARGALDLVLAFVLGLACDDAFSGHAGAQPFGRAALLTQCRGRASVVAVRERIGRVAV